MTKKKKEATSGLRRQLGITLLEEERELLERAAEFSGLPTATWIRTKALEAARAIESQLPPPGFYR